MVRDTEVRFHESEVAELHEMKESEGLGDLPLAAYVMRELRDETAENSMTISADE